MIAKLIKLNSKLQSAALVHSIQLGLYLPNKQDLQGQKISNCSCGSS